jgi:hypothetical protein
MTIGPPGLPGLGVMSIEPASSSSLNRSSIGRGPRFTGVALFSDSYGVATTGLPYRGVYSTVIIVLRFPRASGGSLGRGVAIAVGLPGS